MPNYTPTDDDAATIAQTLPGPDLGTELHSMSPDVSGLFRKVLDARHPGMLNLFDVARHCEKLRSMSTDDGKEILKQYRPTRQFPLPMEYRNLVPSTSETWTDNEYKQRLDTIETEAVDALRGEWDSFLYHWAEWKQGQSWWTAGKDTCPTWLTIKSARYDAASSISFSSVQQFADTINACQMTSGWCAPDDVVRLSWTDGKRHTFSPPPTEVRSFLSGVDKSSGMGSVEFIVTLRGEDFDHAGPLRVLTASMAERSRVYVHYVQYQDCVMLTGANVWFDSLTVQQRFLWAAANKTLDPGFPHGRYGIIERVHQAGWKNDYFGITTPPGASKPEIAVVEKMIEEHCDDRRITVARQ